MTESPQGTPPAAADPVEVVERALQLAERTESVLHAFAYLDFDRARAEAAAAPAGPLSGVVLGVKDIFDTADMPTEYGSPIYKGHQPRADAATVELLRAAGAVVLGKTVTAELAVTFPGPTTNPHRPTHTPGGSSSGSAAGVAAGILDLALGTQTAGSVIRPASFCGVFGFKPTFGTVTTAGVNQTSWSLDTVGWFAADVDTLAKAWTALTSRVATPLLLPSQPPRFAVVRTEQWDDADIDAQGAVLAAADLARDAGATVTEVDLPEALVNLSEAHAVVMSYEMVRCLAWEHRNRPEQLSDLLRGRLDESLAITADAYDAAQARASVARDHLGELFEGFDAVLTPAVTGEAPEGLTSTGDARFARVWTLLGTPALSAPGLVGRTGLPVGVQLVGRIGDDAGVLVAADWLAAVLPPPPTPDLAVLVA